MSSGRAARYGAVVSGALLLTAACASGPGARQTFRGGLASLEDARSGEAREEFRKVREACGTSPLGQQAALVEAAVALGAPADERDPQRAAELTAAFLQQPRPPAWGVPLAESLYRLAWELGAEEPSPGTTASVFGESADEVRSWPSWDCGPVWEAADDSVLVPDPRGRRLSERVAELEKEVERLRDLLEPPGGGGR